MYTKIKSRLKELYHHSGAIFILDAYFLRIIDSVKKLLDIYLKKIDSKGRNITTINSLSEMLKMLELNGDTIYGREIVEQYDEDPSKTILLVSHEMSLSGAPIALFHMAKEIKKQGYQVIFCSHMSGEILAQNIYEYDIPVIISRDIYETNLILKIRTLFAKIIVNTIKLFPIINILKDTDMEVIWWIHEAEESYNRSIARYMPRTLPENIHPFTVGPYAMRVLLDHFPRYKTRNLLYSSPDLMVEELKKSVDVYSLPVDAQDKKVYAIVGVVTRRKGQDVLIRAINMLPDRIRRSCYFVFVGQGCDDYITSKLNRLERGYPENVHYIEGLNMAQICGLYKNVDYLVCSSRDDPMPLVIAEAMSFGVPCICSENTGDAAIIKKYRSGYIYEKNSASKLSKTIMASFYQYEKKYKKMSQNSRKAYDDIFSESIYEKRLKKVLEEK